MAVISTLSGFAAQVRVEGHIAKEYPSPENDTDIRSDIPSHQCYIESISGARFAVEIANSKNYPMPSGSNCLIFRLYIDGVYVNGRVLQQHEISSICQVTLNRAITPQKDGDGYLGHYFVFNPVMAVEYSNHAQLERDGRLAKSLGTIQVKISVGFTDGSRSTIYSVNDRTEEFRLAEKAMKGKEISHGTGFLPGYPVQAEQSVCLKDEKPVGRFLFLYRSLDALRKEFITPPAPPPTEAGDPLSNLSVDEIRNLALKTIRNRMNDNAKLKREPSDEASNISTAEIRPLKIVKLDNGNEAIDLTDE